MAHEVGAVVQRYRKVPSTPRASPPCMAAALDLELVASKHGAVTISRTKKKFAEMETQASLGCNACKIHCWVSQHIIRKRPRCYTYPYLSCPATSMLCYLNPALIAAAKKAQANCLVKGLRCQQHPYNYSSHSSEPMRGTDLEQDTVKQVHQCLYAQAPTA